MSKGVEYQPELRCDNCGELGAFDFMGGHICSDCLIVDEDGIVIGVKDLTT